MRFIGFALLSFLLSSCDSNDPKSTLPKLHPVTGTLSKNGQLVESGYLTLRMVPDNPTVMVTAKINPDGSFVLETANVQDREGRRVPGAPEGLFHIEFLTPQADQDTRPVTLKSMKVEPKENVWTLEIPSGTKTK
jgi:hypothetical protein